MAKPGEDFVTVIQSDFVQEGKRAAVQMAKATGGNAKIIELEGTTGASPAIDRKKGFDEAIKQCSGMQVVVSQDGDFTRAKGQSVAETLLQSHPDATAIYAHNDEMALGAIAAVKAIGKVPGKDIRSSRSTARRTAQGRRRRRSLRDGGVQPALRPPRLPDHDGLRGRQAGPDADHQQ